MEKVTHNTNKYEAFYESIIDFAVKLGLADYSDFKGVDEFAITSFQKSHFIKFPLSIKVFLKYFGEKIFIRPELSITLSDIADAYNKSSQIKAFFREKNYIIDSDGVKIVNGKVAFIDFIDGSYTEKEIININDLVNPKDIIFLYSNFTTTFINATEENPTVHFLLSDYSFTSSRLRLTDHIRSVIFNRLRLSLGRINIIPYNKEIDFTTNQFIQEVNKLEWVSIYYKLYQNKIIPPYKLIEYREEFYKINSNEEENNNLILTIDEFERAFINYIRKQGYQL